MDVAHILSPDGVVILLDISKIELNRRNNQRIMKIQPENCFLFRISAIP